MALKGYGVNPSGLASEKESVLLLNTSPQAIDLNGWVLTDKLKKKQKLSGTIAAGGVLTVGVRSPVQLGNKGDTITLLDQKGLKVDDVAIQVRMPVNKAGRSCFGWDNRPGSRIIMEQWYRYYTPHGKSNG